MFMSSSRPDVNWSSRSAIKMSHSSEEETKLVDMNCFKVQCAIQKVGSSARGIRSSLLDLQKIPKLVTVYARFTNVPPDVARLKFSKGCRQLYNSETRCLIVTVSGQSHEIVAGNFHTELTLFANSLNLIREF